MNAFFLVLLFTGSPGAPQVQLSSFGNDNIAVQSFADGAASQAAFSTQLQALAGRGDTKVCAVVPDYAYHSPLQKVLSDYLTANEARVSGIWEDSGGLRTVIKLPAGAPLSIEHALTYCKLAAPVAFN